MNSDPVICVSLWKNCSHDAELSFDVKRGKRKKKVGLCELPVSHEEVVQLSHESSLDNGLIASEKTLNAVSYIQFETVTSDTFF